MKFDFDAYTLYVPDGYIFDIKKVQSCFLEWMQEQPECITQNKSGNIGFSYGAKDFLKYINDVILCESNEKAYFVQNSDIKLQTLTF